MSFHRLHHRGDNHHDCAADPIASAATLASFLHRKQSRAVRRVTCLGALHRAPPAGVPAAGALRRQGLSQIWCFWPVTRPVVGRPAARVSIGCSRPAQPIREECSRSTRCGPAHVSTGRIISFGTTVRITHGDSYGQVFHVVGYRVDDHERQMLQLGEIVTASNTHSRYLEIRPSTLRRRAGPSIGVLVSACPTHV